MINMGLNHLPKALKVIIIIVLLAALNGGLVYALLYMRDYTVKNIPIVFIVAPIVFVIELIAFISCIFGIGDDEYYYEEDEDEYSEADSESVEDSDVSGDDLEDDADDKADWEDVDFGKDIKESEIGAYEDHSIQGATQVHVHTKVSEKTVILTPEERQKVLDSLGFGTPAEERKTSKDDDAAARRVRAVNAETESVPAPEDDSMDSEQKPEAVAENLSELAAEDIADTAKAAEAEDT